MSSTGEILSTIVLAGLGAATVAWGPTGEVRPGGIYEGRLSGRGVEAHIHRQRHWTVEQVRGALQAAGLRCLAALGQREEGGRVLLSEAPDEERDAKVVYIAESM